MVLGVTIFISTLIALHRHNQANRIGDVTEIQSLRLIKNNSNFEGRPKWMHTRDISRSKIVDVNAKRPLSDAMSNSEATKAQQVQALQTGQQQQSEQRQSLHSQIHNVLEEHPAVPNSVLEVPLSKPQQGQALECIASFEPTCDMYSYVRFWNKHFNSADCFQSPARHPLGIAAPVAEQKYLLFEPDRGGWNNIRMAAETAMIFALATGRVLVMPPMAVWYLLTKNKKEDDNVSTFNKFFDLKKIHEKIDIITMEEFLEKVAKPGLLKAPFPASSVAEFVKNEDVGRGRHNDRLWSYLERACFCRQWEPGKFFIGFNMSKSPSGELVFGAFHLSKRSVKFAAHGRQVIPYDAALHNEKAIYFPGDYRNTHRILTHFYSYLFWFDPHDEHLIKRLVRDRLHYHDDIFCPAGRGVRVLHQEAAVVNSNSVQAPNSYDARTLGGNTSADATYHAYHIRRGDFQYKHTRLSAQEIYDQTKHLLDPTVTKLLYIATDESDKKFFAPFMKDFTVRFLADISERGKLGDGHLNQNHVGMVEQVICANAHTFIGTPLSTFTGYITRMRGYYRDGRYARTFYTMPEQMYQLQQKPELVGPFWAREFAVAHRDIDDDAKRRLLLSSHNSSPSQATSPPSLSLRIIPAEEWDTRTFDRLLTEDMSEEYVPRD